MSQIFPLAATQVLIQPPGADIVVNPSAPSSQIPPAAEPMDDADGQAAGGQAGAAAAAPAVSASQAIDPSIPLADWLSNAVWFQSGIVSDTGRIFARQNSGVNSAEITIRTLGADINASYFMLDSTFDTELQSLILLMGDGNPDAADFNADNPRLFIGVIPYRNHQFGDLEVYGRDSDVLDTTPENYTILPNHFRYNSISAGAGLIWLGHIQNTPWTMQCFRLARGGLERLANLDRLCDPNIAPEGEGDLGTITYYRYQPYFATPYSPADTPPTFIDGYEMFCDASFCHVHEVVDNVPTFRLRGSTVPAAMQYTAGAVPGTTPTMTMNRLPGRTTHTLQTIGDRDFLYGSVSRGRAYFYDSSETQIQFTYIVFNTYTGGFSYIGAPQSPPAEPQEPDPPVIPPEPDPLPEPKPPTEPGNPLVDDITRYEFFVIEGKSIYGGAGYIYTNDDNFTVYYIDADGTREDLVAGEGYVLSEALNIVSILNLANVGKRLVVETSTPQLERDFHQPFSCVLRRVGVNFIDNAYYNSSLGGTVPDRRLVVETDSPTIPADFYTAYRATTVLGTRNADTWAFAYNGVLYVLDAFELDDATHTIRMEFVF